MHWFAAKKHPFHISLLSVLLMILLLIAAAETSSVSQKISGGSADLVKPISTARERQPYTIVQKGSGNIQILKDGRSRNPFSLDRKQEGSLSACISTGGPSVNGRIRSVFFTFSNLTIRPLHMFVIRFIHNLDGMKP